MIKQGNSNREVITTVRHSLDQLGAFSEDSSFSNRELYFLLLRFRAAILAQKLRDRGNTLSRYNYQTIGCVPVEDVPNAEDCPCVPEGNRSFKRTTFKIPKPIGNFLSVISPSNDITYNYIQWDAIQDLRHSRFQAEKNKPYYTIKTNKDGTFLYLYNDKHGVSVAVTGIFENPLEVQNFPDCESGKTDPCFSPLEQEFIIDPELLPVVYDMLLNSKNKYRPRVNDIHNNNLDETQDIRPPVK